MTREHWTWTVASVGVVIALIAGFTIGRSTASGTPASAADTPPSVSIPEYGSSLARGSYLAAVRDSLPPTSTLSDDAILTAGDSMCADLEGFTEQGKDAPYAIRILWTDRLRYLDTSEMAFYGVVLSAAPEHLCPAYKPLGDDIAYWLGV